jgi:hypothetical protein
MKRKKTYSKDNLSAGSKEAVCRVVKKGVYTGDADQTPPVLWIAMQI